MLTPWISTRVGRHRSNATAIAATVAAALNAASALWDR
jgi:hypothetical protein